MEDAMKIYNGLTNKKVDSWFIEEEEILELRRKIGCRVFVVQNDNNFDITQMGNMWP